MAADIKLDVLTREFPREAIKYREGGGGKRLAYIETHTCIHRLNDATGNNWDFEIIDLREMDNRYLCLGKLTIPGHGSRMGIGVQTLQNVAKQEDLVKGAASDALKKAATLFGVALELYGPDYEADTSEDAPVRAAVAPERTKPSQSSDSMSTPVPHAQQPITHRQKQLIFALANEIAEPNRWPSDWVKDDLYTYFAVDSTTKLTTAQGAHAIRALQQVRTTGQPFSDALAATKGA